MRRIVLIVPLLLLCSALVQAEPAIAFDDTKIELSGLTPHGKAILYGVARRRVNYVNYVDRVAQIVIDDDGDGRVSFELGHPVPTVGVWAVVDYTTGHYAVGAPMQAVPLHPESGMLSARRGGAIWEPSADSAMTDILYVMPGRGAWVSRRRTPGAAADTVSIVPGGESGPVAFDAGGVIIAVDPRHFDALAARIDGNSNGDVR